MKHGGAICMWRERQEAVDKGGADGVEKDLEMARRIAGMAAERGGRVCFVGGFIRDGVMGRESSDVDIEIHGMTVDAVRAMLGEIGPWKKMGASFGVFGLRGYTLDIALPRRGGGKGEDADIDPFMGEREAARRRDFTMNAMMQDVLTGEILDEFGGREDIRNRIIRHVDDETFGRDPLRVLRAAQFAARFDFAIAPETMEICRTLETDRLAKERVMGEIEKALMQSEKPSRFFEALRAMGQLEPWLAEVAALQGVKQRADYHPEGDAWAHTMRVVDEAAKLRDRAEYPLGLMLAALLHDVGKADAMQEKDGVIHAYGHETKGVPLAQNFIRRLTREKELCRYVVSMVALHMKPNLYAAQNSRQRAWNALFDQSIYPEDLMLLPKADHLGRENAAPYDETEQMIRARFERFREMMARPHVTGADLIARGVQPGEEMGRMLEQAHRWRLAGMKKEEVLRQMENSFRQLR